MLFVFFPSIFYLGCELDQFVLAVKLELVMRTPVYPVDLKFAVTGYVHTNFSMIIL